jgi:hypothetical protein
MMPGQSGIYAAALSQHGESEPQRRKPRYVR